MSKSIKNTKNKKIKLKKQTDLLDKLDQFFDSKSKIFFWISLFFTILFSILLFNFRVSEAGDDSAYILRAFSFAKDLTFPTYQGPLYPLFLSLFILIFGLNVTLLKSLSLIFILLSLYFFYKACRGRVSGLLLVFVMIIISFNAYILYYASQTFTEAFFLMLQALFFFYFFKYFMSKTESLPLKNNYGKYFVLGMFLLFLGATRSIGFGVFVAVSLFFILTFKWKNLIYTTASFFINYGIFISIKKYIFHLSSIQFATQFKTLLLKDSFNAAKGNEDFMGYIHRFFGNSNLYLSKHLYKFIGFRPEILDVKIVLTILIYILFFVAIYFAFKKNRYLLFTGIYIAVLLGMSFVILQTRWDQDRLILVYFPLILLFFLSGIYYLSKLKSLKILQGLLLILLFIMFFTNLKVTVNKVKANDELLMNNLAGHPFYGITTDQINYIKMSKWAAENTPDSVNIACRKPSISFIYAKRKFYGIYRVSTEDSDDLLQKLKDNNVRYVIMASLRKYPNKKTEYTINTVKKYLYFIQKKYPKKIRTVKSIGSDEPAYLFEIIY